MSAATVTAGRPRDGPLSRFWAFIRHNVLTAYAILAFAYMLLPIAIVVAFSFNDPAGRFNYTWSGFTFKNWQQWDAVPGIRISRSPPYRHEPSGCCRFTSVSEPAAYQSFDPKYL